jgi:hypothetical protein
LNLSEKLISYLETAIPRCETAISKREIVVSCFEIDFVDKLTELLK